MDTISVTRKELHILFFSLLLIPLIFFGSGLFVGIVLSSDPVTPTRMQDTQVHAQDAPVYGESPVTAPAVKTIAIVDRKLIEETGSQTEAANSTQTIVTLSEAEERDFSVDVMTPDFASLKVDANGQDGVSSALPNSLSDASETIAKTPAAETVVPGPKFAAQVGLFSDEERAKRWKNTLDPRFEYHVIARLGSDKVTRYSVVMGPFDIRGEASVMVDRYKMITQDDAFVVVIPAKDVANQVAGI